MRNSAQCLDGKYLGVIALLWHAAMGTPTLLHTDSAATRTHSEDLRPLARMVEIRQSQRRLRLYAHAAAHIPHVKSNRLQCKSGCGLCVSVH